MKKESFTSSLPFRLLVALVIGIGAGLALSSMEGSAVTTVSFYQMLDYVQESKKRVIMGFFGSFVM